MKNRILELVDILKKPVVGVLLLSTMLCVNGCELIRMKKENSGQDLTRRPVARVNDTYLYLDELEGIVTANTPREDSIARLGAYISKERR